jgi:cyanate permease
LYLPTIRAQDSSLCTSLPTLVTFCFFLVISTGVQLHWGSVVLLFIYLFIAVLGLELRPYTLSHSNSPFVKGFLEIGSGKLFVQG